MFRKLALAITAGIFTTANLSAAWTDLCCCSETLGETPWPPSISIQGGVGYRTDDFLWTIAGPDDHPDVLSKLKWKDLQIVEVGGNFEYVSCRNYTIRIEGDYGHIYHGRCIDTDYLFDGEKGLFSRSDNNGGKGSVYDLEGSIGYRFTSTCARFTATPLVGWSWHGQHLHLYDGFQTFDLFFPENEGPIDGLNSTYTTRWYGPWAGGEFVAQVERCAYVFGSFEWHCVSYRGEGKWNLRNDIGPFYHKAHGFGYIARLGGNWDIWDNWTVGVIGTYRNMKTRKGKETIKVFDSEGVAFTEELRFNHAKWESLSVSAFVGWRY